MPRRLLALFELRAGEGAAAAWAAATFFAVLAASFMLRPVRDALVLDGEPEFIPWLFTATFVVMTAVAPVWGALVARWPRARLVPRVYRGFALQLIGFAALVYLEVAPATVGKVFYVWASVFNLFIVSVFWSVCADVARPEQGGRLFGPIAAGGTAGTFVGPLLTRVLVAHVDPAALLLVSAALLEGAVACVAALDRAAGGLAPPTREPIGGGVLGGAAGLARSPYLVGVAGYVLCAACLGTFVYLEQAAIVKAALPDRAARTAFFADIELWTSTITLVIQLLITARLLRWLGPGLVLAVLPVVQGVGIALLGSAPTLAVATAVSSTGSAVRHALARPGRELLFTVVGREDKYKAKNVVDTFVYRLGDFGSAWLSRGLTVAGIAIATVAVPLAAAWAVLSIGLGLAYRRRVPRAPRSSP